MHNFKGFECLKLNFNGKSTVIFGVNGTGKTTILSAINHLSWGWLNRLNAAQGTAFKSLEAGLVHTGSSRLEISMSVKLNDDEYELKKAYTKARPGKGTVVESNKKLYDLFLNRFNELYYADDKDIPVFVNYGTNRSVLDIPLRIRKKHEFSKWTALERTIENELDYRTFFEWFRNQEDYEAEIIREKQDFDYRDSQLECVRVAVEAMMDGFHDLRVKRNPLRMTVTKNGIDYGVDQLSDGEKCTLALFGDLARRLALANPNKEKPLEGNGVVLIDEIELHMHPSWQRKVLRTLSEVFPNIQFIITTHSPQILGEIDDTYNIFFLDENNTVTELSRMDGFDSNYILETFMNTDSKNKNTKAIIEKAYDLISDGRYSEAKDKINELEKVSGMSDGEVITLNGYLKRSMILNAKNN